MKTTRFVLILSLCLFFYSIALCAPNDNKSKVRITNLLEKNKVSEELVVLCFATLPIFELRGAIPWGIWHYHMPWHKAYIISVLGNMIPIPLILIFLKFFVAWLSSIPVMNRFFLWLFARTRRKGAIIQRYKELGLILFVMIPLPVTGAWTGAIAAYIFGLNFWTSLLYIAIGVCIAGVIVTILSLFGIWGAIIAVAAVILLVVSSCIKSFRTPRHVSGKEK